MEHTTLAHFGNQVPEVTRVSLNELIERKQQKDHYRRAGIKAGIFLVFMFAAMLLYITTAKQDDMNDFTLQAFRSLVSDPVMMILAAGLLLGFFQMQHFGRKYLETDEDYEDLRYDLIDRSEELWPDPTHWNNRHVIFAFLKQTYDINLYYK